ncbi:MAG: DUF2723 domain-containing protein [Ignavibacteriales bacterium]|nr:DUF2723 domain-containing protein [Ignavibacteriales bacterium]
MAQYIRAKAELQINHLLQNGSQSNAILFVFQYFLFQEINAHIKLTPKEIENIHGCQMIKKLVPLFWNENIISFLLSVISFCVYLTTMCRSVGFTDSGELATVICTLGIAHPTGYPLFTLLGKCWVMLPISLEEILRLNIFSALLTAVAVGVFFKTILAIRRAMMVFPSKNRKRKEANERRFFLASIIASFVLGFSATFWSQSTAVEVYALHLVLVLLTLWIFVVGLEEQLADLHSISRKMILFAFILGLSFSNHMTTILLAPGFLWLYFRTFEFGRKSFLRILKIAPFFVLGLSVYLYLPIRSSGYPFLDWGHPATLERFFWHVSGKQFRVWMFSGWDVAQKQLNYYVSNFTSEFHFSILVCIIAGLLTLSKQSHRLLIFLALLFGTTIIYAVNYDIFDIDSYFLLSYFVIGFIVAYGINFILEWIENSKSLVKIIIAILFYALPVIQIVHNWGRVNETENKIPQQFVEKAFSDFEPNAIVLATQWDYFISPSLYYQLVRHVRPDVTVVDKSLLQNRSWYFLQLEHNAPWLMERIHPSVNLFLIELNKFEHEVPFNFTVIQSQWQRLLSEIVEQSLPDHPVYVDARIDQEFSPEFRRTPAGLFLRLTKKEDTNCYRSAFAPFITRKTYQPVVKDFTRYYSTILMRDVYWLAKQGKMDSVKIVLAEVLRLEPGNYEAIGLLNK